MAMVSQACEYTTELYTSKKTNFMVCALHLNFLKRIHYHIISMSTISIFFLGLPNLKKNNDQGTFLPVKGQNQILF